MLLELEVDFFLVPYTVYYSVYIYTVYIYTYTTLHYITLHYITLHYIALHCIALHYIHTYHIYISIKFHFFSWKLLHFSWIIRGSPCRRRCSSQHNASGRVPWPWEGRHGSNLWKIIGKPSENHRKTIGKP